MPGGAQDKGEGLSWESWCYLIVHRVAGRLADKVAQQL